MVRVNAVVCAVTRWCVKCRTIGTKPLTQELADISDHITPGEPPFAHTGTDCSGHFIV